MDGFAEKVIHPGREAVVAVFTCSIGRHGDDNGLFAISAPDATGGFEAIHFGHLNIHKNEVEGLLLQVVEDFFTVLGDSAGVAHFIEDHNGELSIDRVVFCEEDPQRVFLRQARQRLCGGWGSFLGGRFGEDGEIETGAFPGLAADADSAMEQMDEPVGQDEAEAGAAVGAGGGVGAGEKLFQFVEGLGVDPIAGVAYFEVRARSVRLLFE